MTILERIEQDAARRDNLERFMSRFPRRCTTGIASQDLGECLRCGAANGEACRKPHDK